MLPISSFRSENVSGSLKVVIHTQHPLIYSWLIVGCSSVMEGMGVCKENPIRKDMQEAALQIHSASEPSDHGFPRNPLLINIRHQRVWRASPPWSQSPHAYLQTSADSPWWDQRFLCVLPMGKAAQRSGWNNIAAKQSFHSKKMAAGDILMSPLCPEGPPWSRRDSWEVGAQRRLIGGY